MKVENLKCEEIGGAATWGRSIRNQWLLRNRGQILDAEGWGWPSVSMGRKGRDCGGLGWVGCGWGGKGARKERIRDNWAAGGR